MKDAQGHGSNGNGGGSRLPTDYLKRSNIGLARGPGFSGKKLNAGAMTDTQKSISRVREQLKGVTPQSGHGAGLLQALKNLGGVPSSDDRRRAFVGQFGNTGGSMASRTFGRR